MRGQAQTITVAVDANGADLGAREVAEGAAAAAARGTRVLLFGPADEIGAVPDGVEVVDAPVSLAKVADPAGAVRSSPGASIVQAAKAVGAGKADALVSGGSTGAALAAALFNIKRAKGVHRPALAVPVPIPGRGTLLMLDVGATVQARSEHLVQFAVMGSAYSSAVLGVQRPRVGLLSNGEEDVKGTQLVREAAAAIAQSGEGLNFVGQVEGTGLTEGTVDVVVTDGFTGNVALKLMEGVSGVILSGIREVATASTRGKLGGLLLRPALRSFRDEIDPEAGGGALMLGLRKVGIVCHGRFTRIGFSEAIRVAERSVSEDVIGRTHAALETAGALRRPAPASASEPTASVRGPHDP